jgi:hypothetical protein
MNSSSKDDEKLIADLNSDFDRMLKMFYLQMKVKGYLKEFKDDYFI